MKKIYRKAKEEDIIYIANLVTDLLGTCNLDLNKSIINNNIDEISATINNYYVCEIDGKVVGACGLSDVMEKDNYNLGIINSREILYLVVHQDYQRQGIGRTLLNKCVENTNEIILYEAWGDNGHYVNSKYLLEKCGFKFYKSLGNDYYKNHNYCVLCVNRNKNCTSCLAELYVKNIN